MHLFVVAAVSLSFTVNPTAIPSSSTDEPCKDVMINGEAWVDIDGDSCQVYSDLNWCTVDGGYGTGWYDPARTFDHDKKFGHTAVTACCACGGGALGVEH